MKMGHFILKDGKVVEEPDLMKWAQWFEEGDRVVAKTKISSGEWEVSTVFLGLDHNFGSGGKPVLWETMVFGGPMDEYQERYSSVTEARRGHNKVVEKLRKLKHYKLETGSLKPKPKRLLRPVKV
jgi:hypothetical protein